MKNDFLNRIKSIPRGQLIAVVLIALGFMVLLDLNGRLNTLYTRREDVATLSTEVVSLYATEVYLHTEVAKMDTAQKLEEFGRESGYIMPGDVPVAPIGVEDENASLEALRVEENEKPPAMPNWRLWWFLLVGE